MKKTVLLFLVFSVLVSCAGKKHIEKQLHSGNYDVAITKALKKLEHNKHKKRKQAYIAMLENAYYKAVDRDLKDIAHLEKDGNPEHYKQIFDIYLDLEARQNAIKPVLPLKIGNKTLNLRFNNYTSKIVDYRYKVSDYLIDKGITLLDSDNKYNAREAYDIFAYIEQINPNFEETRALLVEAHQKGTDHVLVSIENQTHQIIPKRLEEDLLNFNTYGLDQFWTSYHTAQNNDMAYDYAIDLQLKRINISPEHIYERQLLRERDIVDGWEYLLDENGNVVKDSLGNDIKVDKIITARARFFEHNQSKATQLIAEVVFTDLKKNKLLENFPIDSEFIFENQFGTFRGDRRALLKRDKQLLRNDFVHFPSNEQMIFDTGEDLKHKLKSILHSYNLRS